MSYILAATILLSATALTSAQQLVPGICNATALPTFDINQFEGKWYTLSMTPIMFAPNVSCATSVGTIVAPGVINVNTTLLLNGTSYSIVINGTAPNASLPGQLVFDLDFGFFQLPYPNWVLGTDYNNYGIIYQCVQLGLFFKWEGTAVVSRSTSINADVEQQVETILRNNNISTRSLRPVPQDKC